MALPPNTIKLPGVQTTIGIISGKGGVGKTFVACSLAATLAKLGKRVSLLDADLTYPNVFKALGINTKLIPTADNKIVPLEKYGMKIVSMAGLCDTEDEPIVWRGPIISKITQQLLKETLWGSTDILVIDFPTGSSDVCVTIMKNFSVDGLIVVTSPQEIATGDARKTIAMAELFNVPVIGVLENFRGDIFGEGGGGAETASRYNLPFLGSIPMRKQIVALTDKGIPPVYQMEELEMIFNKISRSIVDRVFAR